MALGVNDPTVSPHLKAYIQSDSGVLVVGVIGEGTSRQLTANWESPFEQDSAGSKYERAGGLIQEATGVTSKGTLQSTQVWNGNVPMTFPVVLELYALNDPESEVRGAVSALEQMASPDVNYVSPLGRAPSTCSIQIGRMILYPECLIEEVSYEVTGPTHVSGLPLRATVQMTIQTKTMLNGSDIPSTYG